MFLGIEIGGTKLQLGIGLGDGALAGLWRGASCLPMGPTAFGGEYSGIAAILARPS